MPSGALDLLTATGERADLARSLGMTALEAATNIILPDNGEAWRKLRRDDFSDLNCHHFSPQLFDLLKSLLAANVSARLSATAALSNVHIAAALRYGRPAVIAEDKGFLERILNAENAMDVDED